MLSRNYEIILDGHEALDIVSSISQLVLPLVKTLLLDNLIWETPLVLVRHVGVPLGLLVEWHSGTVSLSLFLYNKVRLSWLQVQLLTADNDWELADILKNPFPLDFILLPLLNIVSSPLLLQSPQDGLVLSCDLHQFPLPGFPVQRLFWIHHAGQLRGDRLILLVSHLTHSVGLSGLRE